MAPPNSRQTLIDYCLRRLGDPVLEINVDQDQIEDRIDEAIQVYSAFMGVDEFTARDAINDLEHELMAEANLSEIVDMDTIHDLLLEGKKIEAVKHYREQTGTDLASAKRAIDELE